MQTKCIIVDDEPPARELLASYIERVEQLKVSGQFSNAMEAFNYLHSNTVDLLFVDIQMPKMNGLDLIKSLTNRPKIIITTAYREFAAEGFDLAILDYLVKPISFDRFLRSISRYSYSQHTGTEQENSLKDAYMFFKVDRNMVKIYLDEIMHIESLQDYIKIVTLNDTYVTYLRIGFMEDKLPEGHFIRIHKSYIIPIARVESFRHDRVTVAGHEFPIGRVFKQAFIKALQNHASFESFSNISGLNNIQK